MDGSQVSLVKDKPGSERARQPLSIKRRKHLDSIVFDLSQNVNRMPHAGGTDDFPVVTRGPRR